MSNLVDNPQANLNLNSNLNLTLINEENYPLPPLAVIKTWVVETLKKVNYSTPCELAIQCVDNPTIQQLNKEYRGEDSPTNVLSFPFTTPDFLPLSEDTPSILGDIILAFEVIEKEAHEQNKKREHHLTHMVIHGVLHLLGYDHISEEEATLMEGIEIAVLAHFNISNPYLK